MNQLEKLDTIYLIDDDPVFIHIASYMITTAFPDAELCTFTSPSSGITAIAEKQPDLLFLDINMPEMDGWETLEQLASKALTNYKIHILSSSIDHLDHEKAKKHPLVLSFIEKPLDLKQIKQLHLIS
tara:strand:+ start:11 stop:391 length:381 start_codon:yes stop_codon:yes gene_type:complete